MSIIGVILGLVIYVCGNFENVNIVYIILGIIIYDRFSRLFTDFVCGKNGEKLEELFGSKNGGEKK